MRDTVRRIWERGTAAWPQIAFPVDVIDRRLNGVAPPDDIEYPADVYLVLACAEGIPGALGILETQFLSAVDAFVTRINSSRAFADEVKQRLRERLLVGPSARILDYRGHGPLGAWLRVASVRIAIDLARSEGVAPVHTSHDVATRAFDPELATIRGEHRSLMERSLRLAVAQLTPRERNVLRMHFVNGWNFARIGRAYRVHRGTVTRWVADIRQRVLDQLVADVGDKLDLDVDQLRSLTVLLRSQVDASLSGVGEAI